MTPILPFHLRCIACLPLVILSGCIQGPNFQKPDDPLPAAWKERASVSDLPLPAEWWKLFGSSELNRLVSQALAGNQDLKAALAKVETARALVGVKRADWFPQVNFGGDTGYQRLSESQFGANFPSDFPAFAFDLERERYKASFDMSYELDLWGRVRRSVESAAASMAAADEMVAAQRVSIAAEVARNYFILRSLDTQAQVVRETIQVRKDAQEMQKSRLEGGLANEIDVARATTELELTNNDLAAIERQRGAAEHALAVLCGKAPAGFKVTSAATLPQPPSIPAGLPSTVLQRRPDVRTAEQNLRSANAEIGVAQASFFPAFKLFGSGGWESVDAATFLNWENRALSIGPSVSLPIFTGGKLKSNLAAAKSRYDEELAKYRQTLLLALREVEDALVDLRGFGRQRDALNRAIASAGDAARLARVRYDKGLASYFEVTDAERTVLQARLWLAQVEGQRLASSVLLLKALGGGWK